MGTPARNEVCEARLGRFAADVIPISEGLRRHPLKICLLGYRSHPYCGGQGIYLKYLSKALVEAGHEVDVISGPPYPHLDPRVRLIEMPGMNLFENGLRSLRPRHLRSLTDMIEWTSKLTGGFAEPYCFGRRVVKYLLEHGRHYNIIHDNQSLSWGMLDLQREGFPLVTTIHHPITSDLEIALKAARNAWQRLLIRRWHAFVGMQIRVARQLRHLVTVSECSRWDIASAFAIDADVVSVVHCGIDIEVFRPMSDVIKVPRRLMATVSADAPLKGTHYLLRALKLLSERYPDVELVMVSKPRRGGSTERLIGQLGIGARLRCVNGIDTEQLVRLYNEAEVVVVPSVYEGFGLPVPVKDSEAIVAAVSHLFDNPERRSALERAGRQRMEELFSWTRAAREMTDYYWRVIRAYR
jgi:glycosyltransferase involved in cell wall biosynthesis